MSAMEDLRALLDERGVEWEAFDDFEQTTEWSTYNGAFVYWARERDGKLLVETTAPTKCSASCTSEQAVAATLGREPDDAAMVKLHNRMNAALLEYERVQGIEQRDGDGGVVVPFVSEMHRLLEEAATLGQGTCHDKNGFDRQTGFECTACGTMVDEYMVTPLDMGHEVQFRYCPGCGRMVVDA